MNQRLMEPHADQARAAAAIKIALIRIIDYSAIAPSARTGPPECKSTALGQ
jgi:hypothetical protein